MRNLIGMERVFTRGFLVVFVEIFPVFFSLWCIGLYRNGRKRNGGKVGYGSHAKKVSWGERREKEWEND